jgi:hypothetical protein
MWPVTARLPGLAPPSGAATPADRRRALAELDDDALTDSLVRMLLALRDVEAGAVAELAELAGLPLGEVVASPFALRAVALAAADGATCRLHELRVPIPWPAEWQAEEAVAEEGHGAWDRGVLVTGKYQSFMQDEPLATFNPVHMAKWGPHELLHRAAGFFWRSGMSRWELYLGARLNELVPVVHWYGLDEVARLEREGFDRDRDQMAPEALPERALWLREAEPALRERARRAARFLREGLAHFERELAALDLEIERGRPVSVPHPFLDASSDAIAYVVGHFKRLTSPVTEALVTGMLTAGREYEVSISAYRARVEALFDELLFGALEWSPGAARARGQARQLWDFFQRAALCGEPYFDAVAPWLKEARAAYEGARAGAAPDLSGWATRIEHELDDPDPVAVGDLAWVPDRGLRQLLDGLESVTPATTRLLDRLGALEEWLAALLDSPHLRRRLPLALRVAELTAERDVPAVVRDLLDFELTLLRATDRDDHVERLSPPADGLPADFDAGRLLPSTAFGLCRFDHDVATLHALMLEDRLLEAVPDPEAVTCLVGRHFDEVVVVPAPLGMSAVWERLRTGATPVAEVRALLAEVEAPARPGDWPEGPEAWIRELLGAGCVGWVPDLD